MISAQPRHAVRLALLLGALCWLAGAFPALAAPPLGATATVTLPPAQDCLYVQQFGADPSGAKDSAAAFQAAIDRSAAEGKFACAAAGTWRLGRALKMKSGSKLAMARDALIARSFTGGTGWTGALFQSASFTSKTNNVSISGGTITATWAGKGHTGRVFSWYGDNWSVTNVSITDWGHNPNGDQGGGRAIAFVGNNVYIANNTIRGPGCGWGCDGIMVHGSEGALIENNDVVSGDDSFCTFPSADPSDPLFNRPIRNVLFLNNKGISTHARAYGGGLHIRWTGTSYPRLSTTIENITVRGLTGEVVNAGSAGLAIINRTAEGTVRNITFDNVHIVKTNKVDLGFQIYGDNGGSISNVTVTGSSFTGTCGNAALMLRKVIGATIRDSRFVASRYCRLAGLATSSSGISVINTVFEGKRQGI